MTGGKAARWKDEDMADTITGKAVAFIERNKDQPLLPLLRHARHPRPPRPAPAVPGDEPVRHPRRRDPGARLVGRRRSWRRSTGSAWRDDTLVLFSSDNGGVMDDGYQDGSGNDTSGHRCNGALRGYKGGPYEGGNRVPFLARWPGKVPSGTTSQGAGLHGRPARHRRGAHRPDAPRRAPGRTASTSSPPCSRSGRRPRAATTS